MDKEQLQKEIATEEVRTAEATKLITRGEYEQAYQLLFPTQIQNSGNQPQVVEQKAQIPEVDEITFLESCRIVAAMSASHPHALHLPKPNLVLRVLNSASKKLRFATVANEKEYLRSYASEYFTKRGLPELVARTMADSFTVKYDCNLTDGKLNAMINLYEDLLSQLIKTGNRVIQIEPGVDLQKPFTVKVNFKYN